MVADADHNASGEMKHGLWRVHPRDRPGRAGGLMDRTLLFVHLLGMAVWVGGQITVGALVPAMHRAGADRSVVRAAAARFGRLSWVALAVLVVTGFWMASRRDWSSALSVKVILVVVAGSLALLHQRLARDQTPLLRGVLEGATLLVSVAVVVVATGL